MEPPKEATSDVEEARNAIAKDAFDYLTEVLEGVESPYFTPYTRQDRRYLDQVAIEKVRQATWDRYGIFDLAEPKLKMTDSKEAQAATFAYLASSHMRQVKAPFYQVPALRTSVTSPRNLIEFVETVGKVKDVTMLATDEGFREIVLKNDWRVAFAFWEANRQLAASISSAA